MRSTMTGVVGRSKGLEEILATLAEIAMCSGRVGQLASESQRIYSWN